jgi:hypothetical protein
MERDTVLFCDFLTRWPTLAAVRRARTTTLEAFFHAHNCRCARLIGARLASIRAASTTSRKYLEYLTVSFIMAG